MVRKAEKFKAKSAQGLTWIYAAKNDQAVYWSNEVSIERDLKCLESEGFTWVFWMKDKVMQEKVWS